MAIKVVVGESSVTAGQMKDFWSKVVDGTIGSENFGGFLENPHKFTREQVTIIRAINILGVAKVITAEQSAKAWSGAVPEVLPTIRYTDEILRGCTESNKAGHTDFRLVYLQGISLRKLRDEIGTDTAEQPCVYNNDWWLQKSENAWATQKFEAGYYLIDFNGRFPRTHWDRQGEEIAKLRNYERAPEAAVAEAVITNFKVHDGERLLENWYHWGNFLSSGVYRVYVGFFDGGGLLVHGDHPSVGDFDYLRVCLLRKFAI